MIAVLLQEMFFGTTDPMMRAWSNEHATSAQRATVLSVASMFGTLGGSIGLVIIGLVARGYGIPSAWLCSAAFFAVTAPGFLLLGRIAARTPLPEVVVPALADRLGDERAVVRVAAAEALQAFGPAAEPARAALERATSDEYLTVQFVAKDALGAIQEKPVERLTLAPAQ